MITFIFFVLIFGGLTIFTVKQYDDYILNESKKQ